MKDSLKLPEKRELKIESKQKKSNFFVLIDKKGDRTIYHTKIVLDFYTFGISEEKPDSFFIILRSWHRDKKYRFSLFALKNNDKFFGIYYGYRKPIRNIVTRYEKDGTVKAYSFSKAYYMEFRFKKGSIFCYIQGIYYLLKSEKLKTTYCKKLTDIIGNLEKEVYEFYGKKLPEGGLITKWIEKNQK
ncbi:DUF226 domain-containing protein [Borrelia puertoricensis]|uniref:DUF226 domain-containing protein n=1 Tax=Borrelia puertoricensis TaxID=2756107 RepID=UPI001FF4A94F|nr:DUF226 domain-containing protein [Borrelia puertoricensis]UPA18413.1 DUF226 domain-containing protein [Borrelia puertoricensis]